MGASMTVPNPDHRTLKVMEFINSACRNFELVNARLAVGVKELAVFWRHFREGDKEMLGVIAVSYTHLTLPTNREV